MEITNWLKNEVYALSDGNLVDWQADEWGDILVIDHGNLRLLTFDSLHEQSRLDKIQPALLMHNYTRAMMLGLAFVKPMHITVLGLGGGCIVRSLHALFTDIKIDAVELRQAVVDLAEKYFEIPEKPQIRIIVCDAKDYLRAQPATSTDLIFADMFHAWGIELFQTQKQFLKQCQRVLSRRGWLVINYHDIPELDSALFTWIKELFEEVLVCPVPHGNCIVYAGNCQLSTPLASYFQNIEPLQAATKIRFDELFKRLQRLNNETTQFQMLR